MKLEYKSIGTIHSCFDDKFGTPRQPFLAPSSWGELQLEPWVPKESLEGLTEFTHIWLLFDFHKSSGNFFKAKVHPPRLDGKKTGLFSTRSPHRFNTIGLSCVRLDKIEERTLFLSSLDLVTGTPILDIKPYIVATDSHPKASQSWTADKPNEQLMVSFSDLAASRIQAFEQQNNKPLQALIEECLRLDPRALPYKGDTENPHPFGAQYGMNLAGHNILFEVKEDSVWVQNMEPLYRP